MWCDTKSVDSNTKRICNMDLLTKEDIEKAGFIYEPDETKCKTRKIKLHFDCNYYESGSWVERTTPEITQEWKDGCGQVLLRDAYFWSHINKVFVPEVEPMSGGGVMCRWVMIKGWGTDLAKKWIDTGLLEGLKPNQLPDAASYMNRVAQELIAKVGDAKQGSPEWTKFDSVSGIVIPVARLMFDRYSNRPYPKFVVEDVSRFWDGNQDLYKALKEGIAQDHDQQIQELYMLHYESTHGTH